MTNKVILASSSGIRLKILKDNDFEVLQERPGIDEEEIKNALIQNNATCLQIAKNLAELKANRISSKFPSEVVIGADQVMELNGKNYSKPKDKKEAKEILNLLNNNKHFLHSAVCVSRGGSMISNFHESCKLKVKNLSKKDIDEYIERLDLEKMLKYGVYQIEAGGLELFEEIHDDMEAIMGLPMKQLKPYLQNLK
ncbi:MAG: Maf family protein [Pelagibacteraceae bacterium]|jgi:septum formation protein